METVYSMCIVICILYWIVGFMTIFKIAGCSNSEENASWILIYAIGPFIWPIILFIKLRNKFLDK